MNMSTSRKSAEGELFHWLSGKSNVKHSVYRCFNCYFKVYGMVVKNLCLFLQGFSANL